MTGPEGLRRLAGRRQPPETIFPRRRPRRGRGVPPPRWGGAVAISHPVADADRLISVTPPASKDGADSAMTFGNRSKRIQGANFFFGERPARQAGHRVGSGEGQQ